MKVLVTGASGHLGNILCRMLVEQGHHVVAAALDATTSKSLAGLDIAKFDADIRDRRKMDELLQNQEIVFHLASIVRITKDHDKIMQSINIDGTKIVAEAALKANVKKFIHVSSIHALSAQPKNEMINEQRELALFKWNFDYDRSKALAEIALLDVVKHGLNAIIINPTGFIGPHDYEPSIMGSSMMKFFQSRMLFFIRGGFNFVDVRDVAKTLINSMSRGDIGERFIVGGEWITSRQIAEKIIATRGFKGILCKMPIFLVLFSFSLQWICSKLFGTKILYSNQSIAHLDAHRYIDDSKARRILQHESRSLTETFHDFYRWMCRVEK